MSFTGLLVPLVTPFAASGDIAVEALRTLARRILEEGASGLVALGTTAEAAALTARERRIVVDVCAEVSAERDTPLIVGTGSNATAESIAMLGALDQRTTAALVVVPYYTRPTENGVLEHFRRLAAASPVPVIVYNIPYRTGRTLSAATLGELAAIPNIVGFKHSVGSIDDTTLDFMHERPDHICVLAGDDLYAGPLVGLGATGGILASANIATRGYADLLAAWRCGPPGHARSHHDRMLPLTQALFAEPNPVVIKAVLCTQGHIPTPDVRLPLLAAHPQSVEAAVHAMGLQDRHPF